jgi:hypothetical protein
MIVYPVCYLNHEGFSPPFVLVMISGEPRVLRAFKLWNPPEDVFNEVKGVRIKLAVAPVSEYSSRSGLHLVKPLHIKPFLVRSCCDYYIFEPLFVFTSRIHGKRKYYDTADEIFSDAVEHYIYNVVPQSTAPPSRIGAFCWKVRRGYDMCLLVRPATVEEFLEEAQRFTARHFLDLVPYLKEK